MTILNVIENMKELNYESLSDFRNNVTDDLVIAYGDYEEKCQSYVHVIEKDMFSFETYLDIEDGSTITVFFFYNEDADMVSFEHCTLDMYID